MRLFRIIKNIAIILLILNASAIHAQIEQNKRVSPDTCTLKDAFFKAKWKVQSRSFFMQTLNEGRLKDDFAFATGAAIGVETKAFHGFQIGLSGAYILNAVSSKIQELDFTTKTANRYELGLFDLKYQGKNRNYFRPEELFLKYKYSKSSIALGRINLNTPFFNPQDGRVRPTFEEGAWVSIQESEKFGFNGGWIIGVAPRSFVKWYDLDKSIGLYPAGVNVDGSKSSYYGNIQSAGMCIANVYYNPTPTMKMNIWNGFLENVMNSSLLELNLIRPKIKSATGYFGLMLLHQLSVHEGGNDIQKLTYMNKGASSNTISAQVGIKNKRYNVSLNYTHITGDGRYLMPREWGRDPFYTFMPRERNEGLGDVNAFVFKSTYQSEDARFKAGIAYGYFHLPDVRNYRLNKYGMPSYHQINLDASYRFQGWMDRFVLKLLVAYKIKEGNTYENLKYVYNKVNMVNMNVTLDFDL